MRRGSLMRRVVAGSLRFRFLVVAGALAMMVFGVGAVRQMPVDVFPEFAPTQVEVQTECLGLSTTDVESLVTVPLEQALSGVPGLDDFRSTSVPQLSDILLIFKDNTDVLEARQRVQERLSIVEHSLPTWASPPVMLPPVSATGRVLQIGIWSNSQSLIQLSQLTYWRIRPQLLRVPGVSNVAIWNERQPALQVQVDPARMAAKGVSLEDVQTTTSDALDTGVLKFSTGHSLSGGGFVDSSTGQRMDVEHVLSVSTPQSLAQVPIENNPGVRLGDVATVVQDHTPLIGDAVINGGPGLLVVVEKLPWANTLTVTKGLEDVVRQMQPSMPDVHFDTTIFRPATYINDSIHNLTTALVLGFLLVVVILVLFLFEGRVALISLVTIPLSLMATLLILRAAHATINTMTLAGLIIALGAVVDDAIIDVENILRRLRQYRTAGSDKSTASIILEASLEVRSPIVYATLIIVAAAVPVFLLHGLTASFFRPLSVTYALAIVASMVVALTVTPALTLILLRKAPVERHSSPVVKVLQRGYSALLSRIVAKPRWAYAVFGLVVVLGLGLVPQLGQSLFPDLKQRDVLIHWDAIPGTSDAEMERITLDLDKKLEAIPGVRNFGSHIGRARQGEEVVGIDAAENWISIAPNVDYEATLNKIRALINSYPGLYRDVQTYLNERIEEVISGAKEAIAIRVYGQDLDVLRSKADQIRAAISGVRGTVDVHTDLSVNVPQVDVEVDLDKAAKYGLKPGDVRRAAATLVAGEEVGDVFTNGEVYGVDVWSTPQTRANSDSIGNLLIDTPSGQRIPIKAVASVTTRSTPDAVTRQRGSRYLDIDANVQGRDLASVVHDIQSRLSGVEFPEGYHFELLGEYQERQSAQRSLSLTAVLAGIAIFLLLNAAFGSWRLAGLLFLTLPMALVGGVLGIYLAGGNVTIGALVGFFTVFGIAARNGILLINHCQHLERHEGEEFGPALVIRGARERLSPILMTSLATGLALVPLVLLGNRPGHEIDYPLAVVILGGLVSSTLLTLFVLPSLYLRFGRRRVEAAGPPVPA
ncbi:MAG TPA: efflux RND transporter permease subunit [Rugosimonospora sp.]|nr:efflux RND transporter permease subunit [Rugosimonospora sp.]